MDKIYKLYASTAVNLSDAAHFDFQESALIETVFMDAFSPTVTPANGTGATVEVSFASIYQGSINDIRQAMMTLGVYQAFTTSGLAIHGRNQVLVMPGGLPVVQGTRLYLHFGDFAGTVTMRAAVYFYVNTRPGGRSPGSRVGRRSF